MHQVTRSTMPIRHNTPMTSSATSSSAHAIAQQIHNNLQANPNHSSRTESSSRTPVACKICRRRKVRCDGKSPCNSCVTSNRECVYEDKKVQSPNAQKSSALRHGHFQISASVNPPSKILSFQPHSVSPDPLPTCYAPFAAPTLESATGSPNKQESVHINQPNSPTVPETLNTPVLPNPLQETDRSPSRPTRIPYFRFLGPTAIAPGAPFREISLNLVRDQASRKASGGIDRSEASPEPSKSSPKTLPDTELDLPLSEDKFRRAVEIYYSHMGSFILSITKEDLLHSLSKKEASDALKLAISVLAECIEPSSTTSDLANHWSERAKALVMPHLSLPDLDTTLTFLLIAYYEFAKDRDSGLWVWSGLAFRMAIELGLHKSVGSGPMRKQVTWDDSESDLRERIFWSCYHLDRLISSGTGRVTTFLDSEIEIDLPPKATIPTEHSSLASMEPLVAPFHFLTRILILLGKVSDEFNRCKAHDEPSQTRERLTCILEAFRAGLHEFNSCLPRILHFTVDNARRYIEAGHGQAFLLMHLWFHALVIITHKASIGHGWSSLDFGPTDPTMVEWSRASVRTISDMLSFSNLLNANIYLSVPFASQPIMIAACASIPNQSSPSDLSTNYYASHPSQTPGPSIKQNEWYVFNVCCTALENMHARWQGVSWLVSTLRSRACYESDVDLSTSGDAEISTCDESLMNKLMIRHSHRASHFDTFGAPGPLFGLTASGTFHEPASGRLSVLHQPKALKPSSYQDPRFLEVRHFNTPAEALSDPLFSSSSFSDQVQVDPSPSAFATDHNMTTLTSMLMENPNILSRNSNDSTSWFTHSIPQTGWPGSDPVPPLDLPLGYFQSVDTTSPGVDQDTVTTGTSRQNSLSINKDFDLNVGSLQDQPTLPREVLEKLFGNEVGVWESFQNS